jgi:hypothetical protein
MFLKIGFVLGFHGVVLCLWFLKMNENYNELTQSFNSAIHLLIETRVYFRYKRHVFSRLKDFLQRVAQFFHLLDDCLHCC